MLPFRRMHSLQKFAAVDGSVHNHFNSDRSLSSRSAYKQSRNAALRLEQDFPKPSKEVAVERLAALVEAMAATRIENEFPRLAGAGEDVARAGVR